MDCLSEHNFDKSPVTFVPSFASAPQDPKMQMPGIYYLDLCNIAQLIFFESTGYHHDILSATKCGIPVPHSSSVIHSIIHCIILSEAFALEVKPFLRRVWYRWNASCTACWLNRFITASWIYLTADVFLTLLKRREFEPSTNAGFQGSAWSLHRPAFYDAITAPTEFIISIVNSVKIINNP